MLLVKTGVRIKLSKHIHQNIRWLPAVAILSVVQFIPWNQLVSTGTQVRVMTINRIGLILNSGPLFHFLFITISWLVHYIALQNFPLMISIIQRCQ